MDRRSHFVDEDEFQPIEIIVTSLAEKIRFTVSEEIISTITDSLVWFVGFYGISTFVGYLTPNPFLCN